MIGIEAIREAATALPGFVTGGPDRVLAPCPVTGCGGTLDAHENGNGLDAYCSHGCDLDAVLVAFDQRNGTSHAAGRWLDGTPMDPDAVAIEPLPTVHGFPFLHPGTAALISGPTGGGRSSLVQACAYDAARAGVRVAYLGSEVTEAEFNARASDLAGRRGDPVDDQLRTDLARVRYLNLASTITHAWEHPTEWAAAAKDRFDVVLVDPLSSVASVLDLDFDKSNSEFVKFYDRLVQPLASAGVAVVLLENIGHALEARGRAKGVSAKQDRADLTFSCKLRAQPVGLVITVGKVRTVRAAFKRGDSWTFDRETQSITAGGHEHADDDAAETFRPTVLMERVSRAIEADPGLTRRALRTAVRGNHDVKELALELLIAEEYVEPRQDGKWPRHHSLTPFRADSDTGPKVAPNRSQGPHGATTGPMAPAVRGQGPGATHDQDRAARLLADHADLDEAA